MRGKKVNKQKTANKIVGLLVISLILTCFPTVKGMAAEISPEQQFRQLYLNLLESGDNSQQDISDQS